MMATLAELRDQARGIGLKGFSRMTKDSLNAALAIVEVHRGDIKATRKLGAAYLRKCKVGRWRNKGTSRHPAWQPLSWLVPAGVLGRLGVTPLTQEEAEASREKMSRAAKASYRDRYDRACERIGAIPGSRTAHALVQGRIDPDLAELIAFRAEYRHEHTDYDDLIRETGDRGLARDAMVPTSSIPDNWGAYLAYYGYDGEAAEALARTLKDPRRCHPVWFKEAEVAVRRAGLDLGGLTYDTIREAIDDWRGERSWD
jgi:hypothetical protein